MTISTYIFRMFRSANVATGRPIARVFATVILLLSMTVAGPALAVNKTVNGITLDINMPQAQRGVPYSFQLAPSGRTGPYTFAILSGALPAAFTMSSSGLVTGVNCVSSNGSYNVEVRVTSTDGFSADFVSNQAVSINMTAGPASGCALTGGAVTSSGSSPKVGEYYSATITTTGGVAPYTYTVATGALPTGLSLSSSGTISGTPTSAGSFDFQIKSADSAGNTGYTQYTMSVAVADTVVVSPSSLPTPVLTQAYSQTVSGSGGTSPYTFAVSSGSLPTGLSLATSTGVISGTPTAAGAYSFTIRATDAGSQTGTRSYSGTIAAALAITTNTLPTPVLTQAYSQTVATSGGTAPVAFSISAGSLPTGLSLDTSTGAITGTPTAAGAYSFTVRALDANSIATTKAYSGTIATALAITTATLPTPVLTQAYSQTVATSGGTAPVTFSISAGGLPTGLSLNTSTGMISGTPTAAGVYSFTIQASDANSITTTQAYSGTIAAALAITTNTLPTPVLTQGYSQTVATSGGTAPMAFSISAGSLPAGLSLNTSSGAITGTPTAPGAFSFTIEASDANGVAATQAYSGTISNGLAITTMSLPTPVMTQAYSQTVATTNGTAPVTFSVSAGSLPTGLNLNTSTGAITGTPTAAGAYSFTIQASDAASATATQTYSGTIGAALSITTATLPTPVLSQAYGQTVATSGGTAPVTFSVSAGSLPTGLSLNTSTGAINGTPTASGAYSFTIQASDANSVTATQAYSGMIAGSLSITTASLPTPVLTQAYSQTVATSGGTAPVIFSISAGSLPTGLSLNTSTGAITGTPTAAGAYSFTVRALDANSIAATQAYSGTIAAALSITTNTLPTPVLTQAYGQTVASSGGTAPIAFSISAGSLPTGLNLNTSTGAITGTPTAAGDYSFTVWALDANSIAATKVYSGTIAAALAINSNTLPTPVLTQAYSQTVATSGGTAPVVFSISAGALPAGLSLNTSTGIITGTPTASGAYSFTVRALDANSVAVPQVYTGTIAGALTITSATLPTPVLTQPYNQTVATSGGTAPVTFSVSAGSLPAGLSLNTSTGAITGTPTASGIYSFTIQASDTNSITATRSYGGTIATALTITTNALPTPVLAQAYSQTVATSGGTAPVAFSVSVGSLPTGLSLNTSTGAITGTPTAPGAYSFTVRALDANSTAATKVYSGTITAALSISTMTLPTPVLTQAYSQAVATSGGTAPLTFSVSAGNLPTGLSLNTSTGVITGTPTTVGAFSFTIQAQDNNGVIATRAYDGTIVAALSITTAKVSAPVLGEPYAQSISTKGGTAPVSFSVSGGSLPAGLSLNSANGVISGTPTAAGAFSFTIEARDNNGATATQAYGGSITAALSITTTSLAEPVVNEPYSQAIASSGGVAPVTFSVTNGALPAGLNLDGSGAISGTPTATGGFSFTVQARDANGVVASQSFSGEIVRPMSVAASDLGTLTVGKAYSTPVNVSGGKGPYAFAVTAGALPPGMTLNASGLISGAPTTVGAYNATVQVTDARGARTTGTVAAAVIAAVTANDQSVDVPFNTGETIVLATLGSDDKVEVQTQPAHGQLTPAGSSVEYVPTTDYIGADAFTFIVKGPWGQTRVATVKVNVLPPPPPTAEPPPTATIDATETTGANGDAAVVVDKVDFNLADLVKGIVTDVQIATYPQHGTVELVRSSAIAACGTGGRQCGQASGSAPAITAVYTANKGYVGPDSFTFVAIGPGGVSAPARVNIEVVKTVPTAPVLKATAEGGRKATVDLTANATDGPFLAAALVTAPATSIGTAQLIEGGTATAHTYALEFTSKGAFAGDLTFTYTLTNSTGVSAPLTVILTVKARPDPTSDASVRGVTDAQTEAARRFAGTQMDNFGRRLESLHGNQKNSGFGLSVGSAVGSADDCRLRAHTPEQERICRERAVTNGDQPSANPGDRRIGEVEVWTGGAVTVGRRDADTRLAKLTVQTSGVSGGADVRLTPAFTVGLGGGYASDATKLSGGKGRVDADGWTAATYASLHPRSGVFVDAVAGVGDLTFDTRRTIAATGIPVTGSRDASLRFGSVTAGFDGTAKAANWSLYLRAKALDATLGAYAEQGPTDALAYDQRRLNSLIGVIGGRMQLDRSVGEVRLTPRVRIEFSHEFAAVDPQRIRYADWMDGASYQLMGDAWASDRVTLGVGSGVAFDNGWSLDLDLGAELAKHQSSATARVGAAKRF